MTRSKANPAKPRRRIRRSEAVELDGKRCHPDTEAPICGAKLKRGNEGQDDPWICTVVPMLNGRCSHHGGKATGPKTLKGGGKYSRYRGALGKRVVEAAEDESLTDIRGELAVLDTRLGEISEALTDETMTGPNKRLSELADIEQALKDGDSRRAEDVLAKVLRDCEADKERAKVFAELQSLIRDRVRVFEVWHRAETDKSRVMTAEQFQVLWGEVAATLRKGLTEQLGEERGDVVYDYLVAKFNRDVFSGRGAR